MGISAFSLQTNVISLNAQRNISQTERSMSTSMMRLSSGLRINQASDDAAGLAISERLRSQARGLGAAARNANDGVSMLQTAEGALNETSDLLTRMRELGVQAANGTLSASDRGSVHDEFVALRSEVDRIAAVTEFNGLSLIDGSLSTGVTFQVGINGGTDDRISISLTAGDAAAIGITTGISISTLTQAQQALSVIDTAIDAVTSRRGDIGAIQNRLFTTINNITAMRENLMAANSRIRDADIAQESANFARTQILSQAGVSVLSQANQLPQLALRLIG